MTRGRFLRDLAAAGAGLALGPLEKQTKLVQQAGEAVIELGERLTLEPIPQTAFAVDFTPTSPLDGVVDQEDYPDPEAIIQNILEKFKQRSNPSRYGSLDYLGPWGRLSKYGFITSQDSIMQMIKGGNRVEALLLMISLYYENHGLEVVDSMKASWQTMGMTSRPFMIPLQQLFDPDLIEVTQRGDNWEISTKIQAKPMLAAINKVLDERDRSGKPKIKVLNLSLELGEVKVVIGDDNYLEIYEAYRSTAINENLPEYLRLCTELNKKDIVVIGAAGNVEDDFSYEKIKRSSDWPKNSLLVASYNINNYGPMGDIIEPDLLVYNEDFGKRPASSFSAPITAAVASAYRWYHPEATAEETVKKLLFHANPIWYQDSRNLSFATRLLQSSEMKNVRSW